MTKDEAYRFCSTWAANDRGEIDSSMVDDLVRIVGQHERRAVMSEREACAQIAHFHSVADENADTEGWFVGEMIDKAIRARP